MARGGVVVVVVVAALVVVVVEFRRLDLAAAAVVSVILGAVAADFGRCFDVAIARHKACDVGNNHCRRPKAKGLELLELLLLYNLIIITLSKLR